MGGKASKSWFTVLVLDLASCCWEMAGNGLEGDSKGLVGDTEGRGTGTGDATTEQASKLARLLEQASKLTRAATGRALKLTRLLTV
jgi:hypothetical protein